MFKTLACTAILSFSGTAAALAQQAPATPNVDWTGPYVGAVGGLGGGRFLEPVLGANVGQSINGESIGVVAGFNIPLARVVAGLELDLNHADLDKTNYSGPYATTTSLRSLGSVRARLGFPLGPVLPYLTAGLAAGEGRLWTTGFPTELDVSRYHTGTVFGAGIEVAISDSLSVKAEGLHYSLNTTHYSEPAFSVDNDFRWTANVGRLGVNFRF